MAACVGLFDLFPGFQVVGPQCWRDTLHLTCRRASSLSTSGWWDGLFSTSDFGDSCPLLQRKPASYALPWGEARVSSFYATSLSRDAKYDRNAVSLKLVRNAESYAWPLRNTHTHTNSRVPSLTTTLPPPPRLRSRDAAGARMPREAMAAALGSEQRTGPQLCLLAQLHPEGPGQRGPAEPEETQTQLP